MKFIKYLIWYIFEGFCAGFNWSFGFGEYEDVSIIQAIVGYTVVCGLVIGILNLFKKLIHLIKFTINKIK